MTKPRYQDIAAGDVAEVTDDDGTVVRVVVGEFWGKTGPVEGVAADPRYLDVWVPPLKRKTLPVDWRHHAFAYVFEGSGTFRDASRPFGVLTEKEDDTIVREQTGNRSLVALRRRRRSDRRGGRAGNSLSSRLRQADRGACGVVRSHRDEHAGRAAPGSERSPQRNVHQGRREVAFVKLDSLVQTSKSVAAASGRLDKISKLAAFLAQLTPDEVAIAIGFFIGWPRQGRIGVGWATVAEARGSAAAVPTLELSDVDRAFDALQAVKGKGSAAERLRLVRELFARATADEQEFLAALAIGEVRQGALEGVMLDAVAKAANVPRRSPAARGDARRRPRRGRARGLQRWRSGVDCAGELPHRALSSGSAHARRLGVRRGRGVRRERRRPRSSGSSTARASRCIARTIASRCTRAT